jgi:murein DD-endopeptidase MepM/ murein hydrolase activator NlpD
MQNVARKNTKYRFNEETLNFEPYQPSALNRFWSVFSNCVLAALLGLAAFLIYNHLFDSPETKQLREENSRLAMQYELLSRQLDEIDEVLAELEQRDDNMYRAILQSEPVENRKGNFDKSNRYEQWSDLNHYALVKKTSKNIDELSRRIYLQSKSYDELVSMMKNNEDRMRHTPAIQPVKHAGLKREASGYGWRIDPIYNYRKFHEGIDFSLPVGNDVYATADGVISHISYQRGGYGYLIKIDHGYGYETRYAHLKLNSAKVKKGQKVKRGDVIALSGHTGKSTAPHLHYEVRINGKPDNPIHYFFKDLTAEEYDDMLMELSNSGVPMD